MRPKGNGLVDIVDEKRSDDRTFFCMRLVRFLGNEDHETWMAAFEAARNGRCPYRKKCDKFRKTFSWKRKKRIRNSAARRSTAPKERQENTLIK